MKLVTKLGLSIVALSNIAYAGSYTTDVDAFSTLHPAGIAVQITTNSAALAYYADRHAYTAGVQISPYNNTTTGGVKTNGMTTAVFARKNIPLTTNTVFGFGLSTSTSFGKNNGAKISNSYSVASYGLIEYAATKNVYLSASISPVNYTTYELAGVKTKTWSYFGGSACQLSYRFQ